MHGILTLASMPGAAEIGEMLYQASLDPENEKDDWLTKAIFASVIEHSQHFLTAAEKQNTESGLLARLKLALASEKYELGRRNTLQFCTDLEGKELNLSVEVTKRREDISKGVILAQGGKENGYSFFLEDGKLNFVILQNGKKYQATSTKPLPESFSTSAHLAKNGEMRIFVNEQQIAQAKANGLFTAPLSPSVRTGRDLGGVYNVGEYEGEFPFEGNLQKLVLELKK
jgi:hypothetical protein